MVQFSEVTGHAKDVGEVETDLAMSMSGMVLHSSSDIMKGNTIGVYQARIEPRMIGNWVMKISWKGPDAEGQADVQVTVNQ